MKPAKPQHQHYVPQFYLRYFAFSPKKRSQIYVHDLQKNNKSFITAIKNVAQERNFYETNSGPTIEPALAQLEGIIAKVWKKLAAGNLGTLTQEDRMHIALFVCTMMVRTAAVKERFQDMVAGVRQRLNLDDSEMSPTLMMQLDVSQDALTRTMNGLIAQSIKWVPLLLDMFWLIGSPPAGWLFPTSDNPVVKDNTASPDSMGLTSPGIELYLPVSSKFVLIMVDAPPELKSGLPEHFQYTRESLLHLTHLLVLESSRYLFSQDGRINFEEGMLRSGPRVIVS